MRLNIGELKLIEKPAIKTKSIDNHLCFKKNSQFHQLHVNELISYLLN